MMFCGCVGRTRAELLLFSLAPPRALRQSQPRLCGAGAPLPPPTQTLFGREEREKKSEDKLRLTSVFSLPATPITPLQPNHSLPLQSRPICKRNSSQCLSAKAFNYCHLGGCARLPSRAFSYFSEDTAPGLDAPKMPFVRLYLKRALPACWEAGEKVPDNPCALLLHGYGNHSRAVAGSGCPMGYWAGSSPCMWQSPRSNPENCTALSLCCLSPVS